MAPVVPVQRLQRGPGQLQRPLLRHRAALPHAALRHHLHCGLQVAHEQTAGLHHVPALLRLRGGERHAGGSDHHLPRDHMRTPRVFKPLLLLPELNPQPLCFKPYSFMLQTVCGKS